MPFHDVGNVRFKKFRDGSFMPALETLSVYDCHPPPQGSVRRFNPQTEYAPVVLADYLQNAEIQRIREGAAAGATPQPEFSAIWDGAMQGLDIKPLTIDLTDVPQDWLGVELCHVKEIHYEVAHKVWQILVAARVPLTLDGVNYPAGDAIAAFRVCEPEEYRFVKIKTFSERCCPGQEPTGTSREESKWFPIRIHFTPWGLKYYMNKYDLRIQGRYYYDREIEGEWEEE